MDELEFTGRARGAARGGVTGPRPAETRWPERRPRRELWVPAEELDEFNAHIVGEIQVIHTF